MTCGWTGVCRLVFRKVPSSNNGNLPPYHFYYEFWRETTVAHNCHGNIICSRQNFNLQNYYQINFNGINTTLFHGTNTFSRHKHFFTSQTLFHETNTFSRHKQFFSRHKQFFHGKIISQAPNGLGTASGMGLRG